MVIGLFIITAIPAVTGIAQAISAQKNQEQRQKDEKRMSKFNIDVHCEGISGIEKSIHNGRIVVKDQRLWIGPSHVSFEGVYGYVSECMIVEYPDKERTPVALGLVSQVQDNPPLLNWIYVDKNTMELKYGNKTASIDHHIGAWDWTEDEEYLTIEELFGGHGEDFIAVENKTVGRWQLFYLLDDEAFNKQVPSTWTKLRVRLHRTLLVAAE